MARKTGWSLFAVCLGLSLGWHFLSALAIGTAQEPQPVSPPVLSPVMSLRPPVEMLQTGVDQRGFAIRRPIVHYQDPDFFAYPRTWDMHRYDAFKRGAAHDPRLPVASEAPRTQAAVSTVSDQVWPLLIPRIPPASPQIKELPLEEADKTVFADASTVKGAPIVPVLQLEGPLSQRPCLLHLQPVLAMPGADAGRELVLGEQAKAGAEGLKIRMWVNAEGVVRMMRLESSSGNPRWDKTAMQALRQWQFAKAPPGSADTGYQWGRAKLVLP